LLDGSVFDSSLERDKPLEFVVDEGNVIKGWDLVVKTMKKGEKARVTLKPEYAYGDSGSGEKIPPNSVLIFEMELMSFQNEKDLTKNKDRGVLKILLQEGEKYQTPNYESIVVVSYDVKLAGSDDVIFHVNNETYKIGEGQLSSGLELSLESMKSGEKSQFTIQPQYTFGEFEPDATLVYTIQLHSFEKIS